MKYVVLMLLNMLGVSVFCENVHVIYVSAVIENQAELRKSEYLKSFYALKSYGFDPWIIEAMNINHSFFDEISDKVFYPQKNNLTLKNQGVNEIISIKEILPLLPFEDEDIVIKLTGRYFLYDTFFIDTIRKNGEYDAYVKWIDDQVFTGCIAMKWKYFKQALQEVDLVYMENNMINMEQVFADFIRKEKLKDFSVDKVHILARIYGKGLGNTTYDW
jgi:hypothetical protein